MNYDANVSTAAK